VNGFSQGSRVDISVVLGTFNRAPSLRKTLESFSQLAVPGDLRWELLVVDNNSTDATRLVTEAFIHRLGPRVRYIFEAKQGRSAALNAGIAAAEGNIVAFTDDDVLLDKHWLSNLKQTFESYDCSAVAGRVVPRWNHPKPAWLTMEDQLAIVRFEMGNEFKEILVPPLGANSAFRKEVFERHGLFRLDLGVSGSRHTITCDDTEFGERLIQAGDKIVYCPTAIIYHPVDPKRATKRYFRSWYYYNGRSLTRTLGIPREGVSYFGVPRWLYRELIADVARWLFTFKADQRLHNKFKAYRKFGVVVEARRLSRQSSVKPSWKSSVGYMRSRTR
jgi:glucosyl-dolichyl phosphate glucuronosyltransferase